MEILTPQDLQELAAVQDPCCISIYMPTYRFESQLAQNPIRLKNLLKAALKEAEKTGCRTSDAEALLAPARALLDDDSYWLKMKDGLAIFLHDGEMRTFRMPASFPEVVCVGTRFHLKHLFPLVGSDDVFYLLSLSKQEVKLFRGTRYQLVEMDTTEIPQSIQEALWADDRSSDLSLIHPGARVERAAGHARYQGHGHEPVDQKHEPHDELLRFFQQIDEGLRVELRDENAPLLLAGVDYYLPIYRRANEYVNLVDKDLVSGNQERVNTGDLHAKAWSIIGPAFEAKRKEHAEEFQELSGNGGRMASTNLREIVPASVFSRIDKLFVPLQEHVWGKYDADGNKLEVHDEKAPGDEDLHDLAAVYAYRNGAKVHVLDNDELPMAGHLAATFRFAADVEAAG